MAGRSSPLSPPVLDITPKTAGTYIERIYTKINSSTRATAMLYAVQHGLLDPSADER